jgi:hypothetical protein
MARLTRNIINNKNNKIIAKLAKDNRDMANLLNDQHKTNQKNTDSNFHQKKSLIAWK